MFDSLILQVFLSVFVIGGVIIILFFIIRNIFAPRKINTLRNYIKTEKYKGAITLAKEIISKDRNNTEAHFLLGEAYYKSNKAELALMEFKIAEKSGVYDKINEKELREKLADLYYQLDDTEESLKEYLLLNQKYPSEYFYPFRVGELFEKKGMEQQAIKYYIDSIKLNRTNVAGLVNAGVLLYNMKNYTEAHQYLKSAVSKEPNNAKAHYHMGLLLKVENNMKAAMKSFELSSRNKEYKVRSLLERGLIQASQQRYDEAAIELDRALKNAEGESNLKNHVRYALADCYEKNRNITEAIVLWEDIYAIKPNFRDVAEKLSHYQDLRLDDRMKDFLTATDTEFVDMCHGIINNMGLNILEEKILSNDSIEFNCLESDSKWRNMKKRPKLILISRSNAPIDQKVLRDLNEKMREFGIIRGVILTSSTFSKLAISFAKERPIELIDKEGLQELLQSTNI